MNELISIIVPVYNVEKYLNQCLDSVCMQTYKNLEIILIDDGSTDKSGEICDEYAAKDNRIIVIHKENIGVSDSRNKGLDIATGNYIGFVDSDDWIEFNMFEILYKGIKEYKADISICGHAEVYENGLLKPFHADSPVIFSPIDAIEELIKENSFRDYLVNKLFTKKLFNSIRLPVGRIIEDKAIMYKLFDQSDAIVYLSEVLYYYRKRPCSLSYSPTLSSQYGNYKAEYERYICLSQKYPTMESILFNKIVTSALHLCEVAVCQKTDSGIESQISDIKILFSENIKRILKTDIARIYKILILMLIFNRYLFKYCFKIYRIYGKIRAQKGGY